MFRQEPFQLMSACAQSAINTVQASANRQLPPVYIYWASPEFLAACDGSSVHINLWGISQLHSQAGWSTSQIILYIEWVLVHELTHYFSGDVFNILEHNHTKEWRADAVAAAYTATRGCSLSLLQLFCEVTWGAVPATSTHPDGASRTANALKAHRDQVWRLRFGI